ncbi:KH domain-containing protein [Candidatus Woesearchaeota archaeon]|nr:KH domain-containing protein [Candidatus Woesearchaeota archaeon]
MEEFSYEFKIPKDRIAVLIGKNGKIKKELEESTKTRIDIDSKDGDVHVYGKDAILLFNAREVILAIGRGFNPEYAFYLLKGDYILEVINLGDFVGKSKKALERIKGRIIGTDGKTRRLIEEMTEAFISVYGKTVSIIGEPTNLYIAKKAIESLINGSQHSAVYKWLEKKRRELKRFDIETKKTM